MTSQNSFAGLPLASTKSAALPLVVAGGLLTASGLFHVFVWLLVGGDWEGPVSWRKPILFGISTGVTSLSVAWFFGKLRPRKWDLAICQVLSVALVVEVALITFQQWRGEASHFNHTSTLNSFVETSMTILIVLATIVLFDITLRTFSFLNAEADIRLAVRSGMAFLMLSCTIGFWVLFNGQDQIANGRDPSSYGRAGVAKFPHGVAIHAIQLFPLLCWLLRGLGIPLSERVRLLRFSIAALAGFLAFSLVQTLQGFSRFELSNTGALILIASAAVLGPVILSVVTAAINFFTIRIQQGKLSRR